MAARIRHTVLASLLLTLMTTACANQAQQVFDEAQKFYDSGEYQKAIDSYTEVIRLEPKHVKAYNMRGVSYNVLGQHERAIQDYTEAIRFDPEYEKAYYNRGDAYYDLGQYEKAVKEFTEAIRVDPRCAFAYASRSNAYERLGQHDKADADRRRYLELLLEAK